MESSAKEAVTFCGISQNNGGGVQANWKEENEGLGKVKLHHPRCGGGGCSPLTMCAPGRESNWRWPRQDIFTSRRGGTYRLGYSLIFWYIRYFLLVNLQLYEMTIILNWLEFFGQQDFEWKYMLVVQGKCLTTISNIFLIRSKCKTIHRGILE